MHVIKCFSLKNLLTCFKESTTYKEHEYGEGLRPLHIEKKNENVKSKILKKKLNKLQVGELKRIK